MTAANLKKDSITLVGGEGIRRGVMALAGIIAFRALPLAEMGVLSVAIAVASSLRVVCAGGVPLVVRRDMVLDSERSYAIWNSGLYLVALTSCVCLIISPLVFWGLRAENLLLIFILVMFYHAFGAITDTYNALLIAKSHIRECTIVDISAAISLFMFTFLAWMISWKSALPYAAAYTLAGICGILVAYGYIRQDLNFKIPVRHDLADMLKQSIPFAIDAIIITAYFRISVAGVYWLDGEDSSALYAAGQSFAFIIGMVPARIAIAALPRLVTAAQCSSEALSQSVNKLWRYLIPMGGIIVAGSLMTCPWWLPLILGEKGEGAVIHCILIGLSRFPVFISTPAVFALDVMYLQKLRVIISLSIGISLAMLGIPMTIMYGAIGMSIALLMVETGGAAAYVILYLVRIRTWKPVPQKVTGRVNELASIRETMCLPTGR